MKIKIIDTGAKQLDLKDGTICTADIAPRPPHGIRWATNIMQDGVYCGQLGEFDDEGKPRWVIVPEV